MTLAKLLVLLTAAFFVVYGILFALFPSVLSDWVTGSVPTSASALIEMRATNGGLAIALGIVMFLLSRNEKTLPLGLVCLFTVLLCMATARVIGILLDGTPNTLMYVYLIAELVPSVIAIVMYRSFQNTE